MAMAVTMQLNGTEERKFIEVHTYDKETGYYVTSVFPVSEENALKEQAVSITEEIIRLMKDAAHSENGKPTVKKVNSGACSFRKRMLS